MFPPWALWVIGPVTVIAAALIILGVVLGIRAAQNQIETQRRQEVGIALQRAVDFQAEGKLQDAVAEYRRVLMLDPGNETALAGIQAIVDQATSGELAATQPVSGTTPGVADGTTPVAGAVIAPTATVADSAETQTLYDQARTIYGTGQWEQAVTLLLQLQQQAPDFQRSQVEEMLYNAYVNLAAAADQADDLELAISYVDKALALRPTSSALQAARAIAANYVEALNQEGVDWGRAVELYEAVYAQDPNYRDVSTRLNAARFAYGDQLALGKEWCLAEEQYTLALEISVPAGSIARRDDFQARCAQLQALRGGTPQATSTRSAALAGTPTVTPTPRPTSSLATTVDSSITPDPLLTPGSAISDTATVVETPVVETEVAAPVAAGPVSGRLLYAALDPAVGGSNIYLQGVSNPKPGILFYGATQPSMRPDGQRLVFRNLDGAMRGLTALDPATGLKLRFTTYEEDSFPSWNGLGNFVAFASNREGDRRWRLYVVWADVNNEATAVGFGQHPDWHPSEDRFAFQGCDESGNGCGIRSISSGGGDNRGITSVAGDTQPDWSPTGQFLVFTSEARDGNPEVYRVDIASGTVTRLTDSGSIDAAPAVSPDGSWVAFLSNRSGTWAMWAVPSSGGEAQQLFTLEGNVNVWQEFDMQWIN
jgi:TolB protein